MKKIITGIVVFFGVALFPACASGPRMKRCDEKVTDKDLYTCPDVIQGVYRSCEKPVDLYKCTDPQ